MPKKVLFVNQEMTPYVPSSELADMGNQLPKAFQAAGSEIRTFMPKWGTINERRGQLHEVIRLSGINITIDDTDHPLLIKVASIPQIRVQVYFIDNDDFFSRRQMAEDESGAEYADNGQRAIFFARGVLETVKKLRWAPDVIHCQGWMSAVVPLYLKTAYKDEPVFQNAKVVTTLFQSQIKSELGENFKKSVDFREAKASLLDNYDKKFDFIELGKMALDYSDGVVMASDKVNSTLADYAKQKGMPIKTFAPDEKIAETFGSFYDQVCGD